MLLRPANPNDFNFIANSYLKSYRNSPEAKYLINEIYWDTYKERLRTMLVQGQVTIASNGEPVNDIVGYVISGSHPTGASVLHYVYVKHPLRGAGTALELIKAVIPEFGTRMVLCSHTARRMRVQQDKYKLIYNSEYVSQK